MENLHLKNLDQYNQLKTPKQAQSLLLYNLLQIFDNNLQIAYITKYINISNQNFLKKHFQISHILMKK